MNTATESYTVESARRGTVTIDANPTQSEWDAFVHQHADATGYHRWAWRQVFERALGHRTHYLLARQGGTTVGVLPLVHLNSWLFGRALSSLPYVNYGGVLAATSDAAAALVTAAAEIAERHRLQYIVLRHRERQLPDLPVRSHKVTMFLELADTAEAMWTALDKKVRNQIRKAEKSNLTCVSGGEELLEQFYFIFSRNMRDLGTPVYGKPLFAEILRAEPRDARLHIVSLGAEPIACSLTYAYGSTMEVPSASSLREHRALCPNHLLYWTMIQQAIAQGRTRFDFGRSTPGDGTYLFKEQWGAQPVPLNWEYKLLGNTQLPSDDRQSPRYQAKIEAWKKLPLPLTLAIGPRIARCVP
jgi:FemAB-related protein (PEP-CTERM system-associated)